MKIVDLNILLYAVNPSSEHHDVVLRWWENLINSEEPVGIAWIAVTGFLRLATNPRIFPRPLTVTTALEKLETWLRHPNTRLVQETEEHWTILRLLLEESGTAGNLPTDAHLAALAISHGAVLASCDSDFGRFEKLRWENPLRA